MAENIQVEAFQVRVAASNRLTVDRGIAVTEFDGQRFLDPQQEPLYRTNLGATRPRHLSFPFNETDPPEVKDGLVRRLSIDKRILDANAPKETKDLQAFSAIEGLGECALVSIVDYECSVSEYFDWPIKEKTFGVTHLHGYKLERAVTNAARAGVEFVLMLPGSSFMVRQRMGEYFSHNVRFDLTYLPDSENGLNIQRGLPDWVPPMPPDEGEGGEGSGDREPRAPSPTTPSTAASREIVKE